MKKVFYYDYSGKFMGEGEADECQITHLKIQEQKARGLKEGEEEIQPVYILPGEATDVEPKKIEGHDAFFIDGEWVYKEITAISKEEKESKKPELTYAEKRQREYPSLFDYLDGVVKGDKKQIQKYIDDCLAVKAKYPKPV